jgi:hypothetical protein
MQLVETNKRLISQKRCNCCNDCINGLDGRPNIPERLRKTNTIYGTLCTFISINTEVQILPCGTQLYNKNFIS